MSCVLKKKRFKKGIIININSQKKVENIVHKSFCDVYTIRHRNRRSECKAKYIKLIGKIGFSKGTPLNYVS